MIRAKNYETASTFILLSYSEKTIGVFFPDTV